MKFSINLFTYCDNNYHKVLLYMRLFSFFIKINLRKTKFSYQK